MGECYFKLGGGQKTPDIFGDGSDGDFVLAAGETWTEPVAVSDQSVVEKRYNSFTMEAGSLFRCEARNAGLVVRVKWDCAILGTIDQSCLSPKTNPNNSYDYPEELVCGAGGDGGNSKAGSYANVGGTGMPARVYGGGWSAGGSGGFGWVGSSSDTGSPYRAGKGGDANDIMVSVDDSLLFHGGTGGIKAGENGQYGGGAAGGGISSPTNLAGGSGGSGAKGNGTQGGGKSTGTTAGAGGGSGNIGGGVVLLYVGGALTLSGSIKCNGGEGGSGVTIQGNYRECLAAGAGGAGGGSIYIVHAGTLSNTANLEVNGGAGGQGSTGTSFNTTGHGEPGTAGGVGSVTIKQYVKGMEK